MTHPIVQKFLAGNPVAGGTIPALELEIERLQKRIAELEAAQQGVQRTLFPACVNCEYNPCDVENNLDYCPAPERR